MNVIETGGQLVTIFLRLLLAPLDRLLRWYRYRNIDHFEIRWRPPHGRGWYQVDPKLDDFNPSNLQEPIPVEHFFSHADTMGWYQGEYRLVGIRSNNQFGRTIWQTHFFDGPVPEDDQEELSEEVRQNIRAINRRLKEMRES